MEQAIATVLAAALTLTGVIYTAHQSRRAGRDSSGVEAYRALVTDLRAHIAALESRRSADAAYIRVLVRMLRALDVPVPRPPVGSDHDA